MGGGKQQSSTKHVQYSINDAVAIMPLIVGWKPAGKSDLAFLDQFIQYKPPKADILTQSWKPYNAKVYNEVRAAMKLCKTSPLIASKLKDDKDSNASAFSAVLTNIQAIETKIKDSISDQTLKDNVVNNASAIRADVKQVIGSKVGESEHFVKDFIINNTSTTIDNMSKIFKVAPFNRQVWNGLDLFDPFWTSCVKGTDAKYPRRVAEQEKAQLLMFEKIIGLYGEFYPSVISATQGIDFADKVSSAYFSGEGDDLNEDKGKINAAVEKAINQFLWSVLVERFEILNSVVGSFFSLLSMTRTAHVPLVEKFMTYAILSCISPIFKSVKSAKYVGDNAQKVDTCKTFFANFQLIFNSSLDSFLKSDNLLGISTVLTASERIELREGYNQRIVHENNKLKYLGSSNGRSDRTALSGKLETSFNSIFKTCEGNRITHSLPQNAKEKFNILTVFRGGESANDTLRKKVLKLIETELNTVLTQAQTVAKIVAYSKIYYDSLSFGTFHYKNNDLGNLNKYLIEIASPLSFASNTDTEKLWRFVDSDPNKGEIGSDKLETARTAYKSKDNKDTIRKERREKNISSYLRVIYPNRGWNSQTKIENFNSNLTEILPYMTLKEGFVPTLIAANNTQRPKSAPPQKSNKKSTPAPNNQNQPAKPGSAKTPPKTPNPKPPAQKKGKKSKK